MRSLRLLLVYLVVLAVTAALCWSYLFIFTAGSPAPDAALSSAAAPSRSPDCSQPSNLDAVAPPPSVVHVLCAGDNIIHGYIYEDAHRRAANGANYDFIDMYTDIADMLKGRDVAAINQETPIAGSQFPISGYPLFNTPPEAGEALVQLGFNVINIANNHMLDQGATGYQNSMDFWATQPVLQIGGYEDSSQLGQMRILTKNGIRIAFLSYTYGTNGNVLPSSSQLIVPLLDETLIKNQIAEAKSQADVVIVYAHWGDENSFTPSADQRNYAQIMADAGADAIIGMHTHVLEPIKWVARPDGGQTLLAYSLGNVISTMVDAENMVGAILTFDIVSDGQGHFTIQDPLMTPTMTQYDKHEQNLQVYKLETYPQSLVSQHGSQIVGHPFTYDDLVGYVTKTIDPQFLDDYYKNYGS